MLSFSLRKRETENRKAARKSIFLYLTSWDFCRVSIRNKFRILFFLFALCFFLSPAPCAAVSMTNSHPIDRRARDFPSLFSYFKSDDIRRKEPWKKKKNFPESLPKVSCSGANELNLEPIESTVKMILALGGKLLALSGANGKTFSSTTAENFPTSRGCVGGEHEDVMRQKRKYTLKNSMYMLVVDDEKNEKRIWSALGVP